METVRKRKATRKPEAEVIVPVEPLELKQAITETASIVPENVAESNDVFKVHYINVIDKSEFTALLDKAPALFGNNHTEAELEQYRREEQEWRSKLRALS